MMLDCSMRTDEIYSKKKLIKSLNDWVTDDLTFADVLAALDVSIKEQT